MKKIFYFLALFTFTLVIFNGCKKNTQDVISPEAQQSKLSIAEAKGWYSSSVKKTSISNARTDSGKNKTGEFPPLWDKALTTEDDKYFIVESPLKFDKDPGFSIKSTAKSPAVAINGATKLLILKDKTTGEMKSALMHIYSSTGSGAEKINYGVKDEKFSGHIFFTDLNGLFVNGWIYENGKVIKKSSNLKKINNRITAREGPGDGACTTYEIRWYSGDCIETQSGSGNYNCGNWTYIGSSYHTYCTGDGGGGGGGGGGYGDPQQKDCADVVNGTAYRGDCGVCIGGTTGLISCDDPCAEKIALAMQANDTTISNQNSSILTNTTNTGKEYGTEHNLQSTTEKTYRNTTVRTDNQTSSFTPIFTWNSTQGYTVGAAHGHPGGSAPSPADVIWAATNLNNAALVAANNVQFYKDKFSVTTVTSNATYVVTPQNWTSLQTKYNDYIDSAYIDANGIPQNHIVDHYKSIATDYYNNNSSATIQEAEEFALMTLYGDAINLYKATAGSLTFTPLEINVNALVAEVPCQ